MVAYTKPQQRKGKKAGEETLTGEGHKIDFINLDWKGGQF